jgi:4-amino-4-deoxy-L-arabinose transferase-like glycosyltransferase
VNASVAARPRPRLAILLVVAAATALSLCLALSIPLIDPDEGRNAEVAREMVVTHDLVIPHLAGMPYLDKPPALFWAAAAAIRVLGATPLAARLPAMLAAALTLWLLGTAAFRAAGLRFALIATALLAAAPLFAAMSAYVIFDMPLTLCVTTAWLAIAADARDESSGAYARARLGARLAIFAAIALGLLIKGPVMLAWVLGGSATAALLMRTRSPLRWTAWWPGWLIALAIPGVWFALASRRFPEYPHYAFIEESFERLSSGSFHRQQPWWFVPAVLVGGALPWSVLTPWTLRRFARGESAARWTARVGLGFVVFAAVFFTLSKSKLVTYLLPAFPPLAWTAAVMWSDRPKRHHSLRSVAAITAGVGAALVGMHMLRKARKHVHKGHAHGRKSLTAGWRRALRDFGGALKAGLLIAAGIAFWRRRGTAILLTLVLIATPVLAFFAVRRLHEPPGELSGAPLARAIRASGGGAVRYEGCYSPGTDFLLGRSSELVSALGEETTSNYLVRYRRTVQARGLWTAFDRPPAEGAGIIVRSARDASPGPAGAIEFYRDKRFVAYRAAAPGDSSATEAAH